MELDLSDLLVAVIDDNRTMRHIVSTILHKCNVGCVIEAENGADALEQFELVRPDVIFCDWVMQPISGIEFLRKVRAGEAKIDSDTPVIMMTSQVEASQVLEAKRAGVSGYLAKPVTVGGIMARLLAVLGHEVSVAKPQKFAASLPHLSRVRSLG